MVSRATGTGSTTTTVTGPSSQQQTTGPSTQTQTTGPSTTSTSGSSSTRTSTTGRSQEVQTVNMQNMSGTALAALDQLILDLSSGNNASAQVLQQAWTTELAAAQQLREDYSKQAAINDSSAAMSASLAEALELAMPTIAAGIDAAGTSGSAMSSLLTQKAAEQAANQAATLGLQAAISYGQIAANAGQTAASLINTGDPTLNALLESLAVAKGAVQTGTTTNDKQYSENQQQNTSSSQTQRNSGSTSTSVNSGATTTNLSSGNTSTAVTTPTPAGGGSGYSQFK